MFIKNKKPKEVVFEITTRCNLKCYICFNKIYTINRSEKELSTNQVKTLIDKISESPIEQLRFSGGEPLLRKDIFELTRYAKKKGLRVWLNTNATLVSEARAKKLWQYVENVLFPLNSFDSLSELRMTGKKFFNKKIKGVKFLKKYIPTIRCASVATKENIKNLERMYHITKTLKVDTWEVFRPIPTPTNLKPINNDDVRTLIEKLLRINKTKKIKTKICNAFPFCSYEPQKIFKTAFGAESDDGHTRLVIASNGTIKPMYYLSENLGNIFKNDIMECWNSSLMKKLRNLKMIPYQCEKCNYVQICKGGSRVVSKLIHNDYRVMDYLAQPEKYKDELFKKKYKRLFINWRLERFV